MMRAALIVVGLSTLAIMEFKTPPRTTKAASGPLATINNSWHKRFSRYLSG